MVWMWRLLLCFGVYAMFHHVTQFQHSALSKCFCFTFFIAIHIYSYIYKYIFIYRWINYTSHQLHQQIFTIKWTQSEKPCYKFTPQLQHLHHSHQKKKHLPPPNGTRKSPKFLLLLNHVNFCRWLCYQTKRPGGHAIRKLIASNLPATINTESWKRTIMQELGTSGRLKGKAFEVVQFLPPL